jgi:hypothetical protein
MRNPHRTLQSPRRPNGHNIGSRPSPEPLSSNPFSGDWNDRSGFCKPLSKVALASFESLPRSREPRLLRSGPNFAPHKPIDSDSDGSPVLQFKPPFHGSSNPFGSQGLLPEAARGVTPDDPDLEYDVHDLPHPPGLMCGWPSGQDMSSPLRGTLAAQNKPYLRQWLDEQQGERMSQTRRYAA